MDLASVALTTTHGKELLVRDNFILWKYKTFVGKQSTSDYYKCTIQSCLGRLTISEPRAGCLRRNIQDESETLSPPSIGSGIHVQYVLRYRSRWDIHTSIHACVSVASVKDASVLYGDVAAAFESSLGEVWNEPV